MHASAQLADATLHPTRALAHPSTAAQHLLDPVLPATPCVGDFWTSCPPAAFLRPTLPSAFCPPQLRSRQVRPAASPLKPELKVVSWLNQEKACDVIHVAGYQGLAPGDYHLVASYPEGAEVRGGGCCA